MIDTASDMKARTNGIEEAVVGLIASDIKGELRKNDTIGIWTYGDRLNTDFPMEVWSEQKKDDVINDARVYVEGLRYGKRSHLENAMPAITQVARKSERLTVILIFDGDGLIKGTHFDKDINELHKQYVREFKAAHQPLVTVLAVRDGSFVDYTINYPGTIVVPHTADPLPPPPVANPPPVVAAAPPPRPAPAAPAHRKEIILIGSNITHKTAAPLPVVVPPASALLPGTPVTNTAPAAAAIAAPPPVTPLDARNNVAPPEPAVTQPPPVAISQPQTLMAKLQEPEPKIVAPVVMTANPSPPPQAAAIVPPPASSGQQAALFVIAFSLLAIAIFLGVFVIRRSKAGSQQSLISQSIDRTR
ncbi:MAG TPA: hypothetical protein VGO59_01885 [Verrucomicrobiae bacterium]